MERLLHYVWKNRLMPRQGLVTTDGQRVEVLSPGFHNNDAGPDFFCADIVIDGEDWMGNVEIHTFSSDWLRPLQCLCLQCLMKSKQTEQL